MHMVIGNSAKPQNFHVASEFSFVGKLSPTKWFRRCMLWREFKARDLELILIAICWKVTEPLWARFHHHRQLDKAFAKPLSFESWYRKFCGDIYHCMFVTQSFGAHKTVPCSPTPEKNGKRERQ